MGFELHDLVTVGVLVFLEGVLSVDNAVVLALLARQVKPHLRKKALTYGLVGAVGFRVLALAFASHLMEWNWVKYVGGGYLIFVAAQHWFKKNEDSHKEKKIDHLSFWQCGDYATRFVLKYNEYAGANVARLVVANNPIPSGTYRIVLEKAWTPKTHFGVNMLDSREVHVWAAVKDTSVDPTYFDSWPDEFPSPLGLDEAL
jgi:hypothetical protein